MNRRVLIAGGLLAAVIAALIWWKSSAEEPRRAPKKGVTESKKATAKGPGRVREQDDATLKGRKSRAERVRDGEKVRVVDKRTGAAKASKLEFKRDTGPRPILKTNILELRRTVRKEVIRCVRAHADEAPRKTKAMVVFDLASSGGTIQVERVQAEVKTGEYKEFEQCVVEAATGMQIPATEGQDQPDFATYQLAMGYRMK